MTNALVQQIIDELLIDPFFSEYKFRKRDCMLIKKTATGRCDIEFQDWRGYDLVRDIMARTVRPVYGVRYDILHKWFEKYSFKTLQDQRDNDSVGFTGDMIGSVDSFDFSLDSNDFESDFLTFKNMVISNAQQVFSSYDSLPKMYHQVIVPILAGEKELPDGGADWVFEYLKLCKLVSPADYDRLKPIVLQQVELLNSRDEPNIVEYYSKLDVILKDIES